MGTLLLTICIVANCMFFLFTLKECKKARRILNERKYVSLADATIVLSAEHHAKSLPWEGLEIWVPEVFMENKSIGCHKITIKAVEDIEFLTKEELHDTREDL